MQWGKSAKHIYIPIHAEARQVCQDAVTELKKLIICSQPALVTMKLLDLQPLKLTCLIYAICKANGSPEMGVNNKMEWNSILWWLITFDKASCNWPFCRSWATSHRACLIMASIRLFWTAMRCLSRLITLLLQNCIITFKIIYRSRHVYIFTLLYSTSYSPWQHSFYTFILFQMN